jgi:hypothetical protein
MASDARRRRTLAASALAALVLGATLPAGAEEPKARLSYTCVVNGKKLVSDRLIPECINTGQRELNSDGSLKRIVPPNLTDDERVAKEQKDVADKIAAQAMNDAVRRDRNLMQRFPDEAKHYKARADALDEWRVSMKNSNARIALLQEERKKLDEEREFYVNDKVKKPLPHDLAQKLDANDAALEAQRSLAQTQQTEVKRINDLYDAELARLKKLWAGAPAGSLGPLPDPKSVAPAAAPAPAVGASSSAKPTTLVKGS